MQIVCGINAQVTSKNRKGDIVTKHKPVENVTLSQYVAPEEVERLMGSCDNLDDFKRRSFHVVSRKMKKQGIVVFPKQFQGFDQFWENNGQSLEQMTGQ